MLHLLTDYIKKVNDDYEHPNSFFFVVWSNFQIKMTEKMRGKLGFAKPINHSSLIGTFIEPNCKTTLHRSTLT